MNISKLHPIGYEAKTEQGNTYKKSNVYKTFALSTATAINILPYCFPKNKKLKILSTEYQINDIASSFNKTIPHKLKTPLAILATALDFVVFYQIGKYVDSKVNNSRAKYADDNASKQIDNK